MSFSLLKSTLNINSGDQVIPPCGCYTTKTKLGSTIPLESLTFEDDLIPRWRTWHIPMTQINSEKFPEFLRSLICDHHIETGEREI
jgi:hypothetical protein